MGKKHEPKTAKVTTLKRLERQGNTALKNLTQEKPKSQGKCSYSRFDLINGKHPWQDKVPKGHISYPVRILKTGKVSYFNFPLAKEMGLIPKNHPETYNEELNQKIIDTFSLQIINEYDQVNRRRFSPDTIKENEYMATRYLQLQHKDKTGKTSGDGRSIWNGVIEHEGKTWDISSRGTGVTALAPGFVEAGKPLKSGSEEFGYGCGMAELDELYGTAILSEIFHNQGIHTERMLAVVDIGKGLGIGVRAGLNLLRPAHIFNHLKQGDQESMIASIDYLIDRQYKNGAWKFSSRHPKKYDKALEEFCLSYAKFAANMDVDYIFTWLDWDGDNALADAGIIDYGSVRQFGLRYDQYRYDDVDRLSTTLNEQKKKAYLMVQVFAQAMDFAKTGNKKPMNHFKDNHIVRLFDKNFYDSRIERILFRLGFDQNNVKYLLSDHRRAVKSFVDEYDYLERKKSPHPLTKVSDGVNRQALFNIRNILRELPHFLAISENFEKAEMTSNEFFEHLFAENLMPEERKVTSKMKEHCKLFQKKYKDLIRRSRRKRSVSRMLTELSVRSDKINCANRITGNGIIKIVDELIASKKKQGFGSQEMYNVIQKFISSQSLNPDFSTSRKRINLSAESESRKVFNNILAVVEDHSEDI